MSHSKRRELAFWMPGISINSDYQCNCMRFGSLLPLGLQRIRCIIYYTHTHSVLPGPSPLHLTVSGPEAWLCSEKKQDSGFSICFCSHAQMLGAKADGLLSTEPAGPWHTHIGVSLTTDVAGSRLSLNCLSSFAHSSNCFHFLSSSRTGHLSFSTLRISL